jgi:hypothetical protein
MLSKRFITQILLRGLFFIAWPFFAPAGNAFSLSKESCLEPKWSLPKEMSDLKVDLAKLAAPRPAGLPFRWTVRKEINPAGRGTGMPDPADFPGYGYGSVKNFWQTP